MLVLGRRIGQRIRIGDDVVVTLVDIRTTQEVRIGIDAPREVRIVRDEWLAGDADLTERQSAE